VVALVALALAVRLALAFLAPRVIRWDEPDYLTLARNLVTGAGFQVAGMPELHYTPLFPLAAGVAYLVLGNLQWASNTVYIVAGALLVVPVYALARGLFGGRSARVSGVLIAFAPALAAWPLYWGTMTEPLYLLLVFSGIYFTWRAAVSGGVWRFAAAGLFFGAGYLTRPEGVMYLALAGVVLLAAVIWRRTRAARALGLLAAFVVAAALALVPYQVYLHARTGQWMLSGKLGVTYDIGRAVLASDAEEYDRVTASLDSTGKRILWYSPERFERDVTTEIVSDPAGDIRRIGANLGALNTAWFDPSVFPQWLLVPVGLAFLAAPWTRKTAAREVFWAIWLLPLAAFLPFHVETRFFAPAVPITLVWVARGLVGLGDWLRGTVREAARGRMAGCVAAALVAIPTLVVGAFFSVEVYRVVVAGERATDFTHRDAGAWLAANTEPDAKVLSRDLAVALYAGRDWAPSPHAQYAEFIAYARAVGADYVVVDTREVTVLRPWLAALGDPATAPAELQPAATFPGPKGQTLVYRLLPEEAR
jgi:4-amino-4-deoxy-L-arabinose transferase-like glycosyltransferase